MQWAAPRALPRFDVRDTLLSVNQNALAAAGDPRLASKFETYQRLTVRQRKRWWEILFSLEMRNAYDVFDQTQAPVLHVAEDDASFFAFLKRVLLGPIRPFTASVTEPSGSVVWMRLRRPFRFIFHRLEVQTADGRPLGAIQKRWSWIRRIYDVEDAGGAVVAQLFGPILKPWTFEIRLGGVARGAIRKRWSGWGKEIFTDADNFGVELANLDRDLKVLAFAATVLVDVVHFERSKS